MTIRLTTTIRDAFIRAAMYDVPRVDHAESIRSMVLADAVAALPPEVRRVWKDEKTRAYIRTTCAVYGGVSVAYPTDVDGWEKQRELTPAAQAKVAAFQADMEKQKELDRDLRARLRNVAYSAQTRKQLAEMLPEFEKYLPIDEAAANRTVPVVANVVADFVKAGWPKGKKRVAVAA